jgi:hypothetical protein
MYHLMTLIPIAFTKLAPAGECFFIAVFGQLPPAPFVLSPWDNILLM